MDNQMINYSKPETEQDDMEIDLVEVLRNFFRLLSRFWWIVLACIILGTGIYGAYSYVKYTPMYECKATFTVGTEGSDGGNYGFYYSSSTAEQLSKTFPYILNSEYFRGVLLEALGTNFLNGTLSATTLKESNVVTMTVQSSKAEDAFAILNSALEVYPKVAHFVLGTMEFHMIDSPEMPKAAYNKPIPYLIVLYGGGAGGFVGCLLLGILALLRKTAQTPDDMKAITSLKCLTAVPMFRFKARKNTARQRISILDPRTNENYVESIRALRLRLEREMKKNDAKVLMVTSTVEGEGKTTVAINLAEAFAAKKKRVLLIDGDLRKQQIAQILGVQESEGLLEMQQKGNFDGALKRIEEENFWFVGGSKTANAPAKVLSSLEVKKFIKYTKKTADYIIIDSPPCGSFQDAAILEEYSDAVLYVVKHDTVSKNKIREGLSFLNGGKAQLLGYVFNAFPQSMSHYGYGRYGYGKYGYGRYGYGRYGYGKYGYGKYGESKEESQDNEQESENI